MQLSGEIVVFLTIFFCTAEKVLCSTVANISQNNITAVDDSEYEDAADVLHNDTVRYFIMDCFLDRTPCHTKGQLFFKGILESFRENRWFSCTSRNHFACNILRTDIVIFYDVTITRNV